MVNNLSNLSAGYYNKLALKNSTNKGSVIKNTSQPDTVEISSSVSFKGVSQKAGVSVAKKMLLAMAGLLGLSSIQKNTNVKNAKEVKEDDKNIDIRLDEYRTKYPELMTVLDNYDYNDYRGTDRPHYTKAAKIAIVETFEKNPEKAYDLAKKLKYDESKAYDEETLEKISNNFDEINVYSGTMQEKVQKMEIVKQDPRMESFAKVEQYPYYKTFLNSESLAKYSKYSTDDEIFQNLAETINLIVKTPYIYANKSAEDCIALSEYFKKQPLEKALKVQICEKGLNEEVEKIVKNHIDDQESLAEYASVVDSFNGADELLDTFKAFPNEFKLAKILYGKKSFEEIKDFTQKMAMTEELFEEIRDTIPNGKEFFKLSVYSLWHDDVKNSSKLYEFVRDMTPNSKKAYSRMAKDGFYTLERMEFFRPLYEKYPDREITPGMIEAFENDPIARAMGIY